MGNAQSPSTDPRSACASRAFTRKELEDLKTLFVSLAAQSQTNGHYISPSIFKAYFKIHGPLGDRLFDLATQKRNDQKLTFEDLVIAKGTYEKGTKYEIEEFIYQILDVNGDGIQGRSDLEAVLRVILDDILSRRSSEPRSDSRQDIIAVFLNAASFSKRDEGCAESSMSFEDFRKWCAHLPSVRKYLGGLLSPSDPGSQVPRLLANAQCSSLLLEKEYAWHIGGALSQQELDEWKLLYHSAFNGLSFSTFLGNISNNQGPTVLIIKDKEGYIYGGYASQPWERRADFYGVMKSFLFQLYPTASIFRPTGANNNLQWKAGLGYLLMREDRPSSPPPPKKKKNSFRWKDKELAYQPVGQVGLRRNNTHSWRLIEPERVNFSSASIPNGIGFGGRANHFGLFLSANFDRGHTFECTTFGSPCLSKTAQIYPEVIECWGIVQREAQQERSDSVKGTGTVLERFKEDRHMLNMVGLANSSE